MIFQKAKNLSLYWWFLIWPVVIGVSIGIGFLFWKSKTSNINFLSPLGNSPLSFLPKSKNKEIIGFLPYWNIKKIDPESFEWSLFSQIIYFGLSLDESGGLVYEAKGQKDLGALWFEGDSLKKILQKARQNQTKILLTVKSFDNETIDSIITNPSVSQKAVENIALKVKEKNLDGINLDFEYVFDEKVATDSAQKLTEFTDKLNKRLKKDNQDAILSVDLYANAIIYDKPYNANSLSKVCDQLILMAYDFHQTGSTQAGPVAPLRAPLGSRSITEALQVAFEKNIPSEKLILGIPLYGYEWQTVSDEHRANTYPRSGALATIKRVEDLISTQKISTFWDNLSMSPWLVYKQGGETKQIYFENERSISLKLELTHQANLGGIAFWALGYEGENSSFWGKIKQWQENL